LHPENPGDIIEEDPEICYRVVWIADFLAILYNDRNSGRRCLSLSGIKRIMISIPEQLLEEVDGLVSLEKRNRSEFIREAMKLYIAEKKKRRMRDQMKKGYQEMAQINLKLAAEHYEIENEVQDYLEEKLAECK